MLNKKAEVGETVTWVAATVIVIVILLVSIWFSSFSFFKTKKVDYTKTEDVLASKSLFSYILTKENDGTVYSEIKRNGQLSGFNGVLGKNIFEEFYGDTEKYSAVWVGIFEPAAGNEYFGTRPSVKSNTLPGQSYTDPYVLEKIPLTSEKNLEMLLIHKDD